MNGRKVFAVLVGLFWLTTPVSVVAQGKSEGMLWQNRHVTQHVKKYDGAKTCLECHEDEAGDVFRSIHYQWRAASPNITNGGSQPLGKLNTINDFCTNPSISWIGVLTNDDGKIISNGCSKCHVGLGKKPTAEMTPAQLENIDCLVCHSANYQREVVKKADGTLAWQPKAAHNPEQMLSIVQNVSKPTTEMCMRCHVGSGGGINFKRGDLESSHANAKRDFDVHMGSNMSCIQCHKFKDHNVRGAGTQVAGKDPVEPAQCENCHKGQVHAKDDLNKHAKRVYCTSCHIPSFARKDKTDMRRDWSLTEAVPGEGRFEPKIEFKSDVTPVYAWWNGSGEVALPDRPVAPGANGKVPIYKPNGSINDRNAKIYAFKYHTSKLPIDSVSKKLIPIQVGVVFKTGKVEPGIAGGSKAWFGTESKEVGWIEAERYMGLFHEVQPGKKALGCRDCHEEGTRMDWKALGYKADPGLGKLPPKK